MSERYIITEREAQRDAAKWGRVLAAGHTVVVGMRDGGELTLVPVRDDDLARDRAEMERRAV